MSIFFLATETVTNSSFDDIAFPLILVLTVLGGLTFLVFGSHEDKQQEKEIEKSYAKFKEYWIAQAENLRRDIQSLGCTLYVVIANTDGRKDSLESQIIKIFVSNNGNCPQLTEQMRKNILKENRYVLELEARGLLILGCVTASGLVDIRVLSAGNKILAVYNSNSDDFSLHYLLTQVGTMTEDEITSLEKSASLGKYPDYNNARYNYNLLTVLNLVQQLNRKEEEE